MSSFLSSVAVDIVSRFGSNLGNIAIVFNNQRPITYLKKHLATQIGKTFWSPSFFTIQGLLRTTNTHKEINPTAQFFALYEAYSLLMHERGHSPQSIDTFYPIAEVILSDFAQIDYELVNASDVFAELYDMSLLDQQFDYLTEEQKEFLQKFWSSFSEDQHSEMQRKFLYLWKLLPALYLRFKSLLRERKQHSIAGIYRDLAEQSAGSIDISDKYEQLIFVGFNALTKCEARIFKRWQDAGKALFYFDGDGHYVNDKTQEAGMFIRKNIQQYGLMNALGDFPSVLDSREVRIQAINAPGHTAQAKVVRELLDEDTAPSTDTAIILADEGLLIPLLQSIPSDRKVNITMGFPIAQSHIYSLLNLYLDYQQDQAATPASPVSTIPFSFAYRFVNHPLSQATENSKKVLQDHMKETESPEFAQASIVAKASVFPEFFTPVATIADLFKGLLTLLTAIFDRDDISNKLREIERQLIQNTVRQLNQLQLGLLGQHDKLPIALAIQLIRKALSKVCAAILGDPLDGIQIMGLLESRNLNFDHVYLIGANEGILPQVSTSPSFIPYNVRKAYDMPLRENQDALSAYLFYRLMHHASAVDILYNGLVDNSNTGEISRFVKQLEYETSLQIAHYNTEFSLQEGTAKAASDSIVIPKEGKVWEALSRYLITDENDPLRKTLSASAFTLYLNSPLEFFFKYIAEIKEPPRISEGIEANKLGTVIHKVMEIFYLEFKATGEEISRNMIDNKLKALPDICVQALRAVYHIPEDSQKPYGTHQRIILRLSEEFCRIFLTYDAEKVAPFSIVELENEQDYFYDFPLSVGEEKCYVRLQGIIDRVDRSPEGATRIVDYKTGRDELVFRASYGESGDPVYSFFEKSWGSKSNKALVQTLYYTFIFEQKSGIPGVQPRLYAVKHLRTAGSTFSYFVPRKGTHPLTESDLALAKAQFRTFLQEKLNELFNPDIPFIHNPEATVYESNPYIAFLSKALDFEEEYAENEEAE